MPDWPLPAATVERCLQFPHAGTQVTCDNFEDRHAVSSASNEQRSRHLGAALTLQRGLPPPFIAGGAVDMQRQRGGSVQVQTQKSSSGVFRVKSLSVPMSIISGFSMDPRMDANALQHASKLHHNEVCNSASDLHNVLM